MKIGHHFSLIFLSIACAACSSQVCPDTQFEYEDCQSNCNGECVLTSDGTIVTTCYACEEKQQQAVQPKQLCPPGSTASLKLCEEQCGNGACLSQVSVNKKQCYSCIQCPDDTFVEQDSCEDSCDNECVIAAEGEGISCWQCKKSCDEACKESGYSNQQDYSDLIAAKLLSHTCVTGAEVAIPSGNIGECNCTKQPDIRIITTVPECENTPCGPVACGEIAICDNVEVQCIWRGWTKVEMNQFQAMIEAHILE